MKRGSFGELREGKATPVSSPQGSTRGDGGAAEAEALGCQTESRTPPAGGRGSWQGRCGSWGRPETTALRSSVRRPPGRGPDPRGKGVRAAGGRAGPRVLCHGLRACVQAHYAALPDLWSLIPGPHRNRPAGELWVLTAGSCHCHP